MTLSASAQRVEYAGNGATTSFAFSFTLWAASEMLVYIRSSAGVETLKTLTTHYTLSPSSYPASSGNVVMVTAPASGETLVLIRSQSLAQALDLVNGDAMPSDLIERRFDIVVGMLQNLSERIDRSLLLPITSSLDNLALPEPTAGRANNLLGINSGGTAYEAKVPSSVTSLTTVTAFAATLLDDADAAAARATLGVPGVPLGHLRGLTLSRVDAVTFGIATGLAANEDSGTAYLMTLDSAFTKTLSAWASGTGNGGLDTGAVANNTWYHVHLIRKDSDGAIDVLYSASATAPTMPAGYTARRRLGSFKTNGSAQIVAFTQFGDEFLWDAAVIDHDLTNPGTAAVSRTVSTPLGVVTQAILSVGVFGTTATNAVISALAVSDQAGQAPTTADLNGFSSSGDTNTDTACWGFVEQVVRTDTNSQVRTRLSVSAAATHLGIITRGWIDARGRA